MNPPYSRNLHLKILEAVIPVADKVVNISPVRWLQDPFAKYKKTVIIILILFDLMIIVFIIYLKQKKIYKNLKNGIMMVLHQKMKK